MSFFTLHNAGWFTPASQGARVGLFLSMPLYTGPHSIPIIGMRATRPYPLMRNVLSLAHPDYRDHANAFIIGHE